MRTFITKKNHNRYVHEWQDGEVLGIGQLRPMDRSWELASLVVAKEARGQVHPRVFVP